MISPRHPVLQWVREGEGSVSIGGLKAPLALSVTLRTRVALRILLPMPPEF